MKITIIAPNNNIEERKYILKTLFLDFLGLDYDLSFDNVVSDWIIKFGEKTLRFSDAFFSKFPVEKSYLTVTAMPTEVLFAKNDFTKEDNIPIIYGTEALNVTDNEIVCGIDIFASSFYMLSRWEEFVIELKDEFGRCSEDEMTSVKYGLYHRPVVNEYVEFLKNLLARLGIEVPLSIHKYTPFITHDIDNLFRYDDSKKFCMNLAGDILHRKSIKMFFSSIHKYIKYRQGLLKDPYDTFDYLMDLSDKYNIKSHFYFRASVKGQNDGLYDIFDKRITPIIDNIIKRGHCIGFHPSKDTYRNPQQFRTEVDRLRSLGCKVQGGRQHYLLYNIPFQLRNWSENNLNYDAGLGFAFRAGFRCGVCWEYYFFDILERKELPLKIRPLIIMEGSLLRYSVNDDTSIYDHDTEMLIKVVKKYEGMFVFLWHNNNFSISNYFELYKKTLSMIVDSKA